MANVSPTARTADPTLSDQVAEEIRAWMGRRRVTGAALSSALGVSPAWISYRLSGKQEIGLNDLQRIAAALDVEAADLLPQALRMALRDRNTYPDLTDRAVLVGRTGEVENRANGLAHSGSSAVVLSGRPDGDRHPRRLPPSQRSMRWALSVAA